MDATTPTEGALAPWSLGELEAFLAKPLTDFGRFILERAAAGDVIILCDDGSWLFRDP